MQRKFGNNTARGYSVLIYNSTKCNLRQIIQPHILYTLNAIRDNDGYGSLPSGYTDQLISSLVEASRFSGLEWKCTIIATAREVLRSCSSIDYLELLVAQREALMNRLLKVSPTTSLSVPNYSKSTNRRIYAALGSEVIQEALDFLQQEQLSLAINALEKWTSGYTPASPMEDIIGFRLNLLRAKILRYQGNFQDSIGCLDLSQGIIDKYLDLRFDEDIGDLISERVNTLQELGDLDSSQALIETHLGQDHTLATKLILRLSLAECLFAQQRFAEAEALCAQIETCNTMTRIARLRLRIISAKLYHVQSDLPRAYSRWIEALQIINEFPPASGRATYIIYLSLSNILKRQGQQELESNFQEELTRTQNLSSSAAATCWIVGLTKWNEYLNTLSC